MNRTNGTWVVFLCSCNFRNAFIRSLNIEKKTLWMYVLSFMKWPLVQIIFCIQHSEIWMVTSVACIFIAFVRNHNILKGVRKFIQRWKKILFCTLKWDNFSSEKWKSCVKLCVKLCVNKRATTLLSYSYLIFWAIKIRVDILLFFGLNFSNSK